MIPTGGGRSDDIIYTPLPLYHAAAGLIGVLGTIYLGKNDCTRLLKDQTRLFCSLGREALVLSIAGRPALLYLLTLLRTPGSAAVDDVEFIMAYGIGVRESAEFVDMSLWLDSIT